MMTPFSRSRIVAGPITLPAISQRADKPFIARGIGRRFDIHAVDDTTEIDLYDEIGFWGVTAKDFRNQIRQINSSSIRLRINSPGGDVFDGIAMFNDLLDHPADVHVEITGLAASAASIVAMAGDSVSMAFNSFLMIHNAWSIVIGDRNDMRSFADVLDGIDGALADTYAERATVDRNEIVAMMDAETWLTAEAAVNAGFADQSGDDEDVTARFDLSTFRNVPKSLPQFTSRAGDDPTPRDLERSLRDAGMSRRKAKAAVARILGNDIDEDLRDAGSDGDFIAAVERLRQSIERRFSR